MSKGLAAAAAAIGATVAVAASVADPGFAAVPTATTAPPPPKAGSYAGTTTQRLGFSLRVAPTRTMLSHARFGFRVRCADRRTLLFSVSPILAGRPWRLNGSGGTGFTHTFRDTTGERYWIRGRFGTHGTVRGTLSTWWRSPRHGICRSGRVDWSARLIRGGS
ncbi:MAG TPA: hypothetical protein VKV21_08555 [Solirubrobacteraceae bacterium]|nr:hypothetical protein [Solirubrobacteraceae bacterium]